jgi:hypothetical protein
MKKQPVAVLPKKFKEVLGYLKTGLSYQSSDAAYKDEEIYEAFIGDEMQRNADIGRHIATKLCRDRDQPLRFLETCSGPGTMIKDLHLSFPNSISCGVDRSAEMCQLGRKLNPHLIFVHADVLDPKLGTYFVETLRSANASFSRFNIALNSASSLGFFSAIELEKHIASMHSFLDSKTGSYFAEIGYYSSPVAASVNNHFRCPGHFKGEKSIDWTVTTKCYPLTDFHEIGWSAWSRATKKLLFSMSHKLRAIRASELHQIAAKVGFEFRIWHMSPDYSFTALDEHSFYSFDDTLDVVVEFHRPQSPRLDRRP